MNQMHTLYSILYFFIFSRIYVYFIFIYFPEMQFQAETDRNGVSNKINNYACIFRKLHMILLALSVVFIEKWLHPDFNTKINPTGIIRMLD